VFYIQDGQVKLTVVSAQGKEAGIALLETEAFFGEGCLGGQPLCMTTATALTDCTLMRVEKPAMLQVLHAEPAFSALFMAYLLSRNMTKAVSPALLAGGILLLIFGVRARGSFSSDISRFFTGSPTDKAIWMLIGGAVLSIVGVVGLLRG
jgi:CRP-like cAMP-binding protein